MKVAIFRTPYSGKQNILVTDYNLLKSQLVVFGFGSQAFVCGFSRQNICSVEQQGLTSRFLSDPIFQETPFYVCAARRPLPRDKGET